MNQIVECVANISEGRDQQIISKIANAIRSQKETILLHIDIGPDANRTVFTFAGSLSSLRQSVLGMYKTALGLIDMEQQKGEHPRIGVVDVCPFIPIKGIQMAELLPWVNKLAKDIADQFAVPVYLYEESAKKAKRKNIANIRKGEYEGLARKITTDLWLPDLGPHTNWQKSGATVIGARQFLLAYNINLKTSDANIAKLIARTIRGSGHINDSGERVPGLFPSVKSIGWYMEEYGFAQVSTNLTNYKDCSFHQVYEACKSLAQENNTTVTGSELIGLTPLEPLLMAGHYYSNGEMTESNLLTAAHINLGLSSIEEFLPEERVIEYVLETHSET